MSFVGHATWKCILLSDLKTVEVFTIFGSENPGSVYYFRNWKPWKSNFRNWKPWKYIIFSDLKTLEVYTMFGSENPGSAYYFRNWKPWKCILFSDLKTLEVYTIFGTENLGRVYYFRDWKPWISILSCIMSYRSHVRRNSVGGSVGRSPTGKQEGLGGRRPPNSFPWS